VQQSSPETQKFAGVSQGKKESVDSLLAHTFTKEIKSKQTLHHGAKIAEYNPFQSKRRKTY